MIKQLTYTILGIWSAQNIYGTSTLDIYHKDMVQSPWEYFTKGISFISEKGLFKNMKKPCMEFLEHHKDGKTHRLKFSTAKNKRRQLLYYEHTDAYGPTKVTSKDSSRYFVIFFMIIIWLRIKWV